MSRLVVVVKSHLFPQFIQLNREIGTGRGHWGDKRIWGCQSRVLYYCYCFNSLVSQPYFSAYAHARVKVGGVRKEGELHCPDRFLPSPAHFRMRIHGKIRLPRKTTVFSGRSIFTQAPDTPGEYEIRYYPAWLNGQVTGDRHSAYWPVAACTFNVTN